MILVCDPSAAYVRLQRRSCQCLGEYFYRYQVEFINSASPAHQSSTASTFLPAVLVEVCKGCLCQGLSCECQGGKKIALRGGGGDMEAHFPNPPPPLLGRRDGRGGSGRGCPTCRSGGGGVNPTSMAQNDTHVALIILTTQMWGRGGGGLLVEKTFSGQNFVFLHLRRQHPFLHKTKGPTRNPISPTPPLLRRASMSHTPPPPRRAIFRSPRAGARAPRRTSWCQQ